MYLLNTRYLPQVQISENALFFLNLNVIYRLIDLLEDHDPIVKEKVCLILTHLGNYYQGRTRILRQPVVIDRLMFLFMRDRKEIRYAAALCLQNLTRCRQGWETITRNDKIIENLLKVIKNDHVGIVLLHLESLKNLADWEPTKALKENAFQLMLELISYDDNRIVQGAMECLRQLCKHSIGKKLADKYDMMKFLSSYLYSEDLQIILSVLGLMNYTSITTMSKWRTKEFAYEISNRLVNLCVMYDVPVLQLRTMQLLVNLCECPDFRLYIRKNFGTKIVEGIKIRRPENWDGTTATKHYGVDIGHHYRTRYISKVETIKVDLGDNVEALNVWSNLERVRATKENLIKKMNWQPYRD